MSQRAGKCLNVKKKKANEKQYYPIYKVWGTILESQNEKAQREKITKLVWIFIYLIMIYEFNESLLIKYKFEFIFYIKMLQYFK